MLQTESVRPSAVAGLFYPSDPALLAAEVDRLLSGALAAGTTPTAAIGSAPRLLLAPHAGYPYSGATAARAFATLLPARDRIERVVLLGPTHRVAVRGIAVPTVGHFATPLGKVPVDREALARIADLPQVVAADVVHAQEHALEVQLPFLQRVLRRFSLVPLAVGRADPAVVAEVIERLWDGDRTLVVVSSDLSHYLPYAEAAERDRGTIERVLRLDPALDHDQACGATPLAAAVLVARRKGLQPRLIERCNSGDTAGDRRRVVGYASVRFDADEEAALGNALVDLARQAIARRLGLTSAPLADAGPAALDQPGACFVTLHLNGALRGCIGSLLPRRALRSDVTANAEAAAFADPRFKPLSAAEFGGLSIEVSLLSQPEVLPAADEAQALQMLRPGIDGVILEWRSHRGTFLPQVWQSLPQPHDFMSALKRKAGLAADFWSPDLHLARYTVRAFEGSAR